MRRATRLLVTAAAVLTASTWLAARRAHEGDGQTPARPVVAPTVSAPAGDYVGSAACEPCHVEAFAKWKSSLHIQMTRPVAEATVLGDFSGRARLAAHGRSYAFGRTGGKPSVTTQPGTRDAQTHVVDYTLGSKRFQGYLSKLPDGRIYVLPVFWDVGSRRWLDWKETTPVPDGVHDMKQVWNVTCFNCHATNLERGFVPASNTYDTRWTEMGIGCEACHGPGREHIALAESWTKDPSRMPRYSSRADNRELGNILKTFSPRSAAPRETFDTCAYCHGNKRNLFTSFDAGERYEDHALPVLPSEPIPAHDLQGEFWPDGRPNRFNRPQALMESGCFKAGAVTCTSCHSAHNSTFDFSLKVNVHDGRQGDLLCTQCHASGDPISSRPIDSLTSREPWSDAALTAHSFHAPDSAGSRCVNCHMADANWRLLMRRRDHTFQAPVPETTAAFGAPNACTTCHDDKPPEWAARQMDAWWGDADRRRASADVARTLYAAGSGDATVLPALAALGVDRTKGAVVRASALEFIGRLAGAPAESRALESQTSAEGRRPRASRRMGGNGQVEPRVLGALLGAASDPEPLVRAAAVRALGALSHRDERVIAVLTARLVDDARVVRVHAAESLMALEVFSAAGRAGVALRTAQDELIQSLGSFPDVAGQQTTLAWLHSQRGEDGPAEDAAKAAIALDPTLARPHVIRGVLAARAGRFADAVESWKTARKLDPATPNIDKMIEEATRRVLAPGR